MKKRHQLPMGFRKVATREDSNVDGFIRTSEFQNAASLLITLEFELAFRMSEQRIAGGTHPNRRLDVVDRESSVDDGLLIQWIWLTMRESMAVPATTGSQIKPRPFAAWHRNDTIRR